MTLGDPARGRGRGRDTPSGKHHLATGRHSYQSISGRRWDPLRRDGTRAEAAEHRASHGPGRAHPKQGTRWDPWAPDGTQRERAGGIHRGMGVGYAWDPRLAGPPYAYPSRPPGAAGGRRALHNASYRTRPRWGPGGPGGPAGGPRVGRASPGGTGVWASLIPPSVPLCLTPVRGARSPRGAGAGSREPEPGPETGSRAGPHGPAGASDNQFGRCGPPRGAAGSRAREGRSSGLWRWSDNLPLVG